MKFAHLTLATRDVLATAEFFESTLGWQRIRHDDNIETKAAWLEIGLGQELHLLHVPDFVPSPFEREFGRHVAIFVSNSQFERLPQRLVEWGATLIEPERETPFARFFFRDPQGYVFEVIDEDAYLAATP